MNLFTYGTLMFPEVWQRIDVGEFPSQPAVLHGYAVYRVKDAVFPGIVKVNGESEVEGLLYLDLDEDAIFELEAYESDLYKRLPVSVTTDDGPKDCTAFVIPESHRSALTDEIWDAEQFKANELEKYLSG